MNRIKIGIYGGTFNPPHIGHIESAKCAISALGLDKLMVIPAGIPPHKDLPEDVPSAYMRMKMAVTAFSGVEKAAVSVLEIFKDDVCYTVDTAAIAAREHPGAQIFLLVGTDMFLSLETWKDSETLLSIVTPAVFSRSEGDAQEISEYSAALKARYGVDSVIVENAVIDISSSQLREMLPRREGAGYIIDANYAYIIEHGLYGAKPQWEWLRSKAYDMLDPSRVPHVAGCEQEALRLAARWGVDLDDAREAAILHDITKNATAKEHLRIIAGKLPAGDSPGKGEEKLYHAITGGLLAKEIFGVSDAVAESITCHTTGKPDMSPLDKIIYLADYIEPTRDAEGFEGTEQLRELAYRDLDSAMALGLEMSINDMLERGISPNRRTHDALEYLKLNYKE